MSRERPIPEKVAASEDAVEVARIWAASGAQHVSVATGIWEDPAAWGLLLVDLARHIAASYEATSAMNREAAMERVRRGFDAEWSFPTHEPKPSS